MLRLYSIKKKYGENVIFEQLNITIKNHDWLMITGESGSGKTTLLKVLTGLTDCEGKIIYQNKFVSYQDLQIIRRNDFAIVFQEKNFIEEYTIYQNLLIATAMGQSSKQDIDNLLSQFHLQEHKYKMIHQLSGGQLQKLAIIKALLKKPKILFLDEPTANLDESSTQELMMILKELNKTVTIVMVTHDLDLTHYANHIYDMQDIHSIKQDNENCVQKRGSFIKLKKNLSIHFLARLGYWNFKYYYKSYLLAIILLTLASTCYLFSSQLGMHINSDTNSLFQQKNNVYELTIISENTMTKEDVKNLSKKTQASKYDLQLNLLKNSTINQIVIDQNILNTPAISIKKTYDLDDPYQSIVITSKLYEQITQKNSIKIPLKILSSFKKINRIYWTSQDNYLYQPQYVDYLLPITTYQVIDSNDLCIYLDNQTIEMIADSCNKSKTFGNQNITQFSFQYKNAEDLKKAKIYLENTEGYTVYSIYNDLQKIQDEVTQQFTVFHYTSFFIIVIVFLIILFSYMNLYRAQRRQKQIFDEYGLLAKEKIYISLIEKFLFIFITIILSTILSLLCMTLFNHTYQISSFLPQSFVTFYQNNNISIQSLQWFDISYLDILKNVSVLIIFSMIISQLCIYIYQKKFLNN